MWIAKKMTIATVAAVVLACVSGAQADVFVEITHDGFMPDGHQDWVEMAYQGWFDIYVWGSGADSVLYGADFDIGAPSGGPEWYMLSLGTVDPLSQFDYRYAGTLLAFRIEGVEVYSDLGVGLPQDMGSALLLYDNFYAANLEVLGLMEVIPNEFVTDGGTDPTIHSYGMQEIPEPGTLVLLALGGLLVARRRR